MFNAKTGKFEVSMENITITDFARLIDKACRSLDQVTSALTTGYRITAEQYQTLLNTNADASAVLLTLGETRLFMLAYEAIEVTVSRLRKEGFVESLDESGNFVVKETKNEKHEK